jgi:hypothetical protein
MTFSAFAQTLHCPTRFVVLSALALFVVLSALALFVVLSALAFPFQDEISELP